PGATLVPCPDGRTVIGHVGQRLLRWDVFTGQEAVLLSGPHRQLKAVEVAPDGKTAAASAGTGKVILWDTTSGAPVLAPGARGEQPDGIAWPADGTVIATGGSSLRLWDVKTGKLLSTLNAAGGNANPVAFAPDGKTVLATVGMPNGRVRVWSVRDPTVIRDL